MKYCYILITLIVFCITGCRNTTEPSRSVAIPQDFIVYSDEDSIVSNIQTFVKQHDKTMFALYNSDCSACLIGVSLWLKFVKEHPEVTPVFAVHTEQSQRMFWVQTYMYYQPPVYVFFDKEYRFFLANKIDRSHDTFIVDSTGKVIAEGRIRDKIFEKQYTKKKQ